MSTGRRGVEFSTPAISGTRQIANLSTASDPGWGTARVGAFAVAALGIMLWHVAMPDRSPSQPARARASTAAR
jgi:hypothetical protein